MPYERAGTGWVRRMNQAHVDIFSDPVCPWCLVGLTRLDNVLARQDPVARIGISYHPFLLDAATPSRGENVREMLERKYGRSPDEMWDQLELAGAQSGLELDMRKQTRRNPSQRAQVLIMAAGAKGTQHGLAMALSRACYLEARNINDEAVLCEVALAHGFTPQEVDALLADTEAVAALERSARWAPQAGITGVPYFIFNNRFALAGAQPETMFEKAFERALAMKVAEDG